MSDSDEEIDPEVLYYTVQVMALYNPVDPAYFEFAEISVFYNLTDRFYRYTTRPVQYQAGGVRRTGKTSQAGISQ
ncbi:MAG: hypothetical protein MZV63_35160 [Marinilabiliales bacterium]|nr:hypothetical protein [Marinilabiliales bacterium]